MLLTPNGYAEPQRWTVGPGRSLIQEGAKERMTLGERSPVRGRLRRGPWGWMKVWTALAAHKRLRTTDAQLVVDRTLSS